LTFNILCDQHEFILFLIAVAYG